MGELTDVEGALRKAGLAGDVSALGAGQFSTAYLVGGSVVARFPHHEAGVEQLRREVEVLAAVAPTLPVLVPEHVVVRLDEPIGKAYAAHRALPGALLSRERVAAFDASARSAVADQVAGFLEAMHGWSGVLPSVPVLPLAELGQQLQTKVRALLWPRMSARSRGDIEDTLRELSRCASGATVLRHGDVGGNVLYDSDTGRVGVIDFGMTTLSDPAIDAASLRAGLGPHLLDAVAERYPRLVEDARAVDLVQATFAIQDALWSAEQGDWSAVDRTLATMG